MVAPGAKRPPENTKIGALRGQMGSDGKSIGASADNGDIRIASNGRVPPPGSENDRQTDSVAEDF